MKIQALFITLLTIFCLFFVTKQALALDIPNFPTCNNPQGVVKVQYNAGTHGIAGDSANYTGQDTVYQLDSNTLQQCFCSTNGQGIQTNWWKISSLSEGEIQILKNSGWIYIPSGSLWGLENTPYLAKNYNYSCSSNSQGSTTGSVLSGLADPGQVLGLAATGNSIVIYVLGTLGILLLLLGLLVSKKSSRHPHY